ncbi:hypothetical protein P3T76_005403 [Phytophthora citrophthora]|uniref:Uncharacterized protein n=1 Tax=Phytophthora citrophthora TaxID=4793 RepID=A0AAD9GST1_9STRA|nr:hypothetical protein P3T76_005403 [Phytophthora citrophthora]
MKSKAVLASGFFGLAILTTTTAIEIDGEEVAPATPADDWEQVTFDNSTSEMLYSALKNVSSYYPTVSATLMCSDCIAQIEKQADLFRFNVLGCTWDTADTTLASVFRSGAARRRP